jgi:hypothetical protein
MKLAPRLPAALGAAVLAGCAAPYQPCAGGEAAKVRIALGQAGVFSSVAGNLRTDVRHGVELNLDRSGQYEIGIGIDGLARQCRAQTKRLDMPAAAPAQRRSTPMLPPTPCST